jgi:hypothetical protein
MFPAVDSNHGEAKQGRGSGYKDADSHAPLIGFDISVSLPVPWDYHGVYTPSSPAIVSVPDLP